MKAHIATLAFVLLLAQTANAKVFDIIAHRGASGYLPEHTLEATTLAFALGPDFIEQDVVISRDDVAIVLHDIHLDTVTDVKTRFPDRAREDGRYYVRDFTLQELKTLSVHERHDVNDKPVYKDRYRGTKGQFSIATFEEHLELITELNRQFGKDIGVYPEIKSPSWHRKEGVDASKIVIDTLTDFSLATEDANSYVQCFDFDELKRLRDSLHYKGKLVLLIGENSWNESSTDYDWVRTEMGIKEVAEYVNGVGPWLGQLLDKRALESGRIKAARWISYVHDNALVIHPFTYRKDDLPPGMDSDTLLLTLKNIVQADGVFTDHVPPVATWRRQSQ